MTQQLIFSKERMIASVLKAASGGEFNEKTYQRTYKILDKLKTHLAVAYATKDIYDSSFGKMIKDVTKAENSPRVPELALLDSVTQSYDLVEGSDLFKLVEASKQAFKNKLGEAIANKNTKFSLYSARNFIEEQQLNLEDFEVLYQLLEVVIEAQNFVARNKFEDLINEDFDKISGLIDDVKELDSKSKSNKPQPVNKEVWDKAAKKRGRPAKSKTEEPSRKLKDDEIVEVANKLHEKFPGK